jgi:DNA-binding MarR family transcriptional regulator
MDDPVALLGCACFNVRSAARAVTLFYDKQLEPSGLRITQFAILAAVRAAGSVAMHDLAKRLNLDPSTMTRTLQPLEKAGVLAIEEGEDRRRREVVLTARGHRKVSEARALWQASQRALRERLGDQRFDRLVSDLSAVTAALSSTT